MTPALRINLARSFVLLGGDEKAARDHALGVRAVSFAEANHKAPALPANVSVFAGESARVWHAQNTCQKSGAAFEITTSGPSIGKLIWELAPFIALGLVLIAAFGGRR
jgi:hypothetical protein